MWDNGRARGHEEVKMFKRKKIQLQKRVLTFRMIYMEAKSNIIRESP